MNIFAKAFFSCAMVLTMTLTSFVAPGLASPLNSLTLSSSTQFAQFPSISPGILKLSGKVILRVAPKLAKGLVNKYGTEIVKILPGAATALTVIEITLDIYQLIQSEIEAASLSNS